MRARLVCSWNMRDLGDERSSRGRAVDGSSGGRNGRAGGERGASGREWVDRERVWADDMPKGAERGPLMDVGLVA